jgi:MFS family permease
MIIELSKIHTIFLAFCVLFQYFTAGLTLSLPSSFYPAEAEEKGATPSEYGFVFGIGYLSACLFAPFIAKLAPKLGVYNVLYVTLISEPLLCVAFGCLQYVMDKWTFLIISYLLRYIKGINMLKHILLVQ